MEGFERASSFLKKGWKRGVLRGLVALKAGWKRGVLRGLVSLKEGWYFYIRGLCTWTHEGKGFRNCSLYRGAVSHQGSLPSKAHSAVMKHQTTNQRACKTSKHLAEEYHEKSLSTSKRQKWQEWEDLNINRSTEQKTTMQFLIPLKPLNGGSNCVHIYIQIKE